MALARRYQVNWLGLAADVENEGASKDYFIFMLKMGGYDDGEICYIDVVSMESMVFLGL